MRNCQKCGNDHQLWNKDNVTLLGHVTATLCNECRTDHSEWVLGIPEYKDFLKIQAREQFLNCKALAKDPPEESEILEVREILTAVELTIHAATQKWLADKVIRTLTEAEVDFEEERTARRESAKEAIKESRERRKARREKAMSEEEKTT